MKKVPEIVMEHRFSVLFPFLCKIYVIPLKEEGGGGGKRGQKGWPYRRLLPPADTQALRDFSLGFQRRENWNSALPEQNQIWVLCQEEVISLQSSVQAEALRPNSCVQDQGIRKTGRIGRAKERKKRGKGREVNKVSCSSPVGALWPVVCVRRRPGTKGSQLRPLGLVHWQASWPLSTPSGQDVSLSEEESPPVAGTGNPSRASNWALIYELSEETHVLTKQEISLERAPGWRAGG